MTVGERESALDRKGEIERSKYVSVSIYITPSKTLPIVACSMCSYSSTTQREREREREREKELERVRDLERERDICLKERERERVCYKKVTQG